MEFQACPEMTLHYYIEMTLFIALSFNVNISEMKIIFLNFIYLLSTCFL